jgi:CheY-like chemotaxis protein
MPRILIVDDHHFLLESLRLALEADYAVTAAYSVPQALALMDQCMPDLVITDYQMPFVNGLDFLEFLHQLSKPPKVIFYSGCLSRELEVLAIRAGAAACLPKPFELKELKRVIGEVLGA